jgi:flavin-dependent dehydrogenase
MPANDDSFDLAVVGASFAGLACARAAALRGLKVCVIEAKADAGARVHTTGIIVKEAGDELDIPARYTRPIYGVRLYAPSLRSMDLFAPGYYFLTTETAGLLRWLADEAERAGAAMRYATAVRAAHREDGGIVLPEAGIRARYLVGADGARSSVARIFGLGRNTRFLTGLEAEYGRLEGCDSRYLHCFVDHRVAPGYIGWVAPAPGFFQVGLATSRNRKPDLSAFRSHTGALFEYDDAQITERRSGLIPCGGLVRPFATEGVLLVGDAAGMVSPLTGGGIHPALRYGRRAGQVIADHLQHLGPVPDEVLAAEFRGFGIKHALRWLMDGRLPAQFVNALVGTPVMAEVARRVFFHRRGAKQETLAEYEVRLARHLRMPEKPAGEHEVPG